MDAAGDKNAVLGTTGDWSIDAPRSDAPRVLVDDAFRLPRGKKHVTSPTGRGDLGDESEKWASWKCVLFF